MLGHRILDLPTVGACKFPVGQVTEGNRPVHLFCGEPCEKSFCPAHHALVYVKPDGRARRELRRLWR